MKRLILSALIAASLAGAAFAQEVRRETVKFARGASGTTIESTITGYQSVQYLLAVNAGQKLSVQLDTSNSSNYFNVTAPGADAALYNSSMDGNAASLTIPSTGTYVIDVYLMRNAARRDETARYSLTLYAE